MKYPHQAIEQKWQARWEEQQTFRSPNPGEPGFDPNQPKYYVLDMFPYPSGSGLHVGHASGYIGTDIVARRKRMEGYNVLHPMGWDAFGLPAEQYAIQTGCHPRETTQANADNFRRQLKLLGLSYDWSREIDTSAREYVRWTPWMVLALFRRGLLYEKEELVWWCEDLKTVLANEEVINGRSERGNHPCIRKPVKQWMVRITAYAERLLADLDLLDWPEPVKKMQRDWIGRSEGFEIDFAVPGADHVVPTFTTCPETIGSATAIILAPEHPSVPILVAPEQRSEVEAYLARSRCRSERDRQSDMDGIFGVALGCSAAHPLNPDLRLPLYVADYVLPHQGTGAIMCVPTADDRDWRFAESVGIRIVETEEEPRDVVIAALESRNVGRRKVTYKMRDWLFSRQRYWGEPFPLYYADDGTVVPAEEEELPIELPDMEDFTPSEDGAAPLARAAEWVARRDPKSGRMLRRVTDTMPGWAGSCWYWLRFMDPACAVRPFSREAADYWDQVDLYVGGTSHAVMHLLYARFWHKVLFDLDLVSHPEPFARLFNQGMVTAYAFKDEDGRLVPTDRVEQIGDRWYDRHDGREVQRFVTKMAKSLGNVANPEDVSREYGVDALRLYEMFMGPLDAEKPWTTTGIVGCARFVQRVFGMIVGEGELDPRLDEADGPESAALDRALNDAHEKIERSFDNLNFNTAVAPAMEFANFWQRHRSSFRRRHAERFILLLAPFAPHFAEEIWERLGHEGGVARAGWPEKVDVEEELERCSIAVHHNGRLCSRVEITRGASKAEIERVALDAIVDRIELAHVRKVVVVPNRLVNVVTE